jgi:hypothetical protein
MLTITIIFLLWLCLSGLIRIIIRHKKINLSSGQIIIFFGCKIAMGTLYGYIFKRYYNGDDTWGLNHDGILQYEKLTATPVLFVKELFSANPIHGSQYYFQFPHYLENLEYGLFTKLLALFNLVSHGNYYINLVYFNFLGFWGLYFLYKLIAEKAGTANRQIIAAVLFLFPPSLFWLSGIRAEGLLILFTGTLFYYFNKWLQQGKMVHALISAACFGLAFIFRDGFALLLLPALLAWWLTQYIKSVSWKTFPVVYLLTIAFTVAGSFLLPARLNPLSVIAARQHDFFALTGNTRFNLTQLNDDIGSFVKVLPESLLNTFVRPFPWEAKGPLQWFAALENIVVLIFLLLILYKFHKPAGQLLKNPLLWALILAGLFNYIIIGYTVPFPGAIARYKIIPELFLIGAGLLCLPALHYRTTASVQI